MRSRPQIFPALNRALGAANLPEVQIESDPHKEDGGMDEE